MSAYLILALLFAVAVAVFALANTEPVTINFIFDQLRTSLALVIIGSATAGAVVVGIASGFRQLSMRFRAWDRDKQVRRHEEQAVTLSKKNKELENRVYGLEQELTETEAYTAHLEGLLKQRGYDLEAEVSTASTAARKKQQSGAESSEQDLESRNEQS